MDATQHEEFVPTTAAELSRFVRENAGGPKRALYPAGGRTALAFGYAPPSPGVLVSLLQLARVVDYPARDMTVTVEAGLRMDELAETLKAERQQLPLDVPQSNRATLGGVLATNTSGHRRFGYGTMRDYVIGLSAVDAGGRLFKAGGRVVKNVAGYDLCKLAVGSLGTLAIVTQVTLKLRPLPESAALLWATFGTFDEIDDALTRLLTSAARPVCLEVLNAWAARNVTVESRQQLPADRPVLAIGVEGAGRDVDWQLEMLTKELSPLAPEQIEPVRGQAAELVNTALTEFQVASDEPLTFKANLKPSVALEFTQRATQRGVTVQVHAGNGIVIGHLPDEAISAQQAEEILSPLRAFAQQTQGNLTVLSCPPQWKPQLPLFGEPEPAWPLMQRVKASLDPDDLLNPGRLLQSSVGVPPE